MKARIQTDKTTPKKTYLALHLMLLALSLSGVCSKLASGEPFLGLRFCLLYGGMLLILGMYAVGWQQVIKRLPLSVAYANKAVTIIWGMLWSALLFHEKISAGKMTGAAIVICGIILYARSDAGEGDDD